MEGVRFSSGEEWMYSFFLVLTCDSVARWVWDIASLRREGSSSEVGALERKHLFVWFLEHALVNLCLAFLTFPHVLTAFTSTLERVGSWSEEESGLLSVSYPPFVCVGKGDLIPIKVTLLLHAWHCLRFPISREDLFHHAIFLPLIGFPGCLYDWGECGNVQLFSLCGLPGFLIYLLLSMRKLGIARRINEPVFSFLVNAFLRMPLGLFAVFLLAWTHLPYYLGERDLPTPSPSSSVGSDHVQPAFLAILSQLVLSPFNSIGYTFQSYGRAVSSLRPKPSGQDEASGQDQPTSSSKAE